MVLAAYNAKTPEDILAFDIEAYFEKLALLKHLSPTRGNGIQAMVQRVQAAAKWFCRKVFWRLKGTLLRAYLAC